MKKNKYYNLGKISYSNQAEFIGQFIKVSSLNWERIYKYMNKILKEWDFRNHLDKFLYHLITREEVANNTKCTIYTLNILFELNKISSFTLLYDSRTPLMPLELYSYGNIFKFKELNDEGFQNGI